MRCLMRASCITLLGLSLLSPTVAQAQSSSDQDLHAVIESLQKEVARLKNRVEELEKKESTPASAPATPQGTADLSKRVDTLEKKLDKKDEKAGSDFRVFWKNSLRMETNDGRVKLRIGGRIQSDFAWFDQDRDLEFVWDPLGLASRFVDTEDGAEARRARIYLSGSLYDNIAFKTQYDFAGGDADFKDAYIAMHDLPYVGTVKVGQFKEPFSLEELTSSNNITFMERALPNVFVPSRNTGVMLHDTAFDERMTWSVGAFRDTNDYAEGSQDGSYSVTARLTGLPWYAEEGRELLHLGVSYSYRNPEGAIRYRERPEAHLSPWRYVDTGSLLTDNMNLWAFEGALVYGPFSLQSEYIRSDLHTYLAGNRSLDGYYVEASYFLTGENRNYKTEEGAFGGIKPRHSFRFHGDDRGWGAWQIALRYSNLDLNDGPFVRGGEEHNVALGLNWYLNPNTRIMLNYIHAFVDHDLYDGDLDILQTRFQFEF